MAISGYIGPAIFIEYILIKKPVKLEHIGALVAQANDTIVFDNIVDYPEFRMVDQLFVNRKAQALVLGCQPNEVVKRLDEVLRTSVRITTGPSYAPGADSKR